jgi:site-specific DNA-methyltransferase (adenine-specific)
MLVEDRPIDSIRPYENNPRFNDAAVDAVAASIKAYGFRQPIVVDEQNVIIVGHTRYKAAIKLGMKTVPVHVAKGLTPGQAKAYRLADNQTATIARWDEDKLPFELLALQQEGFDLSLTGFSGDELLRLLGDDANPGLADLDDVPEPPQEPETEPGDLWVLGEHRLLCGDATRPDDVHRLLGGAKAAMLFTDPPWNVAIGQDANPRHRQRAGLKNDNLPDDQFAALLDGFLGATKNAVSGDVYCVLGAAEWPRLDTALRQHGYHWSATLIWVKDTFVLGRSKYHRRYEPIWYGWHGKGKSSFTGRRDLDDVWELPRPKRSEEHPTMKPVELVRRAIAQSSQAGQAVLDLFAGAGSTLIAAEQAERQALLMEIDPGYCDVVVRRWERFTGKTAERQPSSQ